MRRTLTVALSWGAAMPAHAGGPQAAVLPEVVVSATRTPRDAAELPVAIDAVDARAMGEGQSPADLSQALRRVPGVSVLDRHNYAQDVQISLRGFGARSTFGVRGIRLIADGIPATSPDGQAQTSSFALSSAERIEVMRGPFSSLYGNAAGGVIQVFTADGPRVPTLSGAVEAGSYGSYRLDAQAGGQHGELNYRIDGSRFHTGGYREHSAATRHLVNGKFRLPAASGVLTLVVNGLDQPQAQDPQGLTRAQAAANPRQVTPSVIALDTRKSVRQSQMGLVYEFETDARNRFEARVYGGDRQVTQYLGIPLAVQAAPTHSGGVVDLDRGYGGAGLRWTHDVIGGERRLTLTSGLDYDRQAERRKGFLNVNGRAGALKRDERDVVSNIDAYAQLEWRLSARWSVAAGLRHSRVRFHSRDDFLANGDDSGGVAFSRTNPVAGVVYRIGPAWQAYASVGRGFETPTFAELAYRPSGAGLNLALQPATSVHREVGMKARPTSASRVSLALFHINTSNEIVVDTAAGGRTVYRNAPGTRRSGAEAAWSATLPAGFEAYASYTRLDAEFTQPYVSGGAAVAAGSKLAGVPQHTFYGELAWRHARSGFHAAAEVRSVGRIHVDDRNSEAADAYAVASVRAGLEQRGRRWRVSEFVRVNNVADRQYAGSVIVGEATGRFYEPAPGRNYLVGLSASFAFD